MGNSKKKDFFEFTIFFLGSGFDHEFPKLFDVIVEKDKENFKKNDRLFIIMEYIETENFKVSEKKSIFCTQKHKKILFFRTHVEELKYLKQSFISKIC